MENGPIYDQHLEVFLLWACRETGVLDALLDGPASASAVAEAAGVTERAAFVSLETLVELGYADRDDAAYAATEALDGFRPETDLLDRGILPHRLDSLEHYMDLPELLRTGEAPEHTEAGLRNYMAGMATVDGSNVRAIVTAAEYAHPRPDRVLDVGGGPGKFSREFARRGADVTTLDIPPVVELLEDHYADAGLDVVAGDARESLPTGFDLVFSARMISSFSPAELRSYLEQAFEALDPGGTLVCTERVWDRSEVARRFAVHMLTIAPDGHLYSEREYEEALGEAGFVETAVPDVPGTPYQAIVGHKPE